MAGPAELNDLMRELLEPYKQVRARPIGDHKRDLSVVTGHDLEVTFASIWPLSSRSLSTSRRPEGLP